MPSDPGKVRKRRAAKTTPKGLEKRLTVGKKKKKVVAIGGTRRVRV